MPLETPFHSRTAELNQARRWRNWSGFFIADSYMPAHDLEYHAVRFSAALFDITPMCKYRLTVCVPSLCVIPQPSAATAAAATAEEEAAEEVAAAAAAAAAPAPAPLPPSAPAAVPAAEPAPQQAKAAAASGEAFSEAACWPVDKP